MRSRYGFFQATLAAFFLFSATFAFPQSPPDAPAQEPPKLTGDQKREVLEAITKIIDERVFVVGVDLKKWPNFVEKYKEDIDKAENERTFSAAVNRAFREFGFSHIRLRTPRAANQRRGGPVAIGFGMTAEKKDIGLEVASVVPESPAAKAGIESGDIITAINGATPNGIEALNGEAGSLARLKIQKKSGTVFEIELQRSQFSTARKDVVAFPEPEIAVVKIHTFSQGYQRGEVEKLFEQAAKAKFLVLDLRSNGGGATTNLRHLLSLIMPSGTEIGTFVNKADATSYAEKNSGESTTDLHKLAQSKTNRYKTSAQRIEPFAGKVAVLVNRGSASASEICAAALREQRGAKIIGAKTAGAVLASVYGRLPHGYELQYPVSDYITAKGMRLEANPLMPDAETNTRVIDGTDEALTKAIELLKAAERSGA